MAGFFSTRRMAAVLIVGVLAAVGAGCGGEDAEDVADQTDEDVKDEVAEKMLALDFWEFDQSLETGWRPYAEREEYEWAADLIDHYLAHRINLIEAYRGYLHLHAGQLRAYHGDDRRALDHLDQAYVTPDSMTDRFPRSFNHHAAGERAFMRGDMAGVRAAAEEIRAMPAMSSRDSMFLESLEFLATQEGKTYKEAEFSTPE